MKKILFIASGSICVGLGVAGIFLPVLPTTPFILLASACYIRSSDKLYNWLISHKYLGKYISNYNLKKGMPVRAKVSVILTASLAIILSSFCLKEMHWKIVLYGLGVIMLITILLIKTAKEQPNE